jgi:zeaxanthin glucosyltransferase
MSGLVVFVSSTFTSHIYGTMGLGRRLQKMGYAVEYWGEPSIQRVVQAQGFRFGLLEGVWHAYERLFLLRLLDLVRNPATMLHTFRVLTRRRRQLEPALDRFERSLDLRLSGQAPALLVLDPWVAAYCPLFLQRRLRCVIINHKPVPTPDPIVPPPTSGWIPRPGVLGLLGVRIRWLRERFFCTGRRVRNAVLEGLGCYTPEHLLSAVERRAVGAPALHRVRRAGAYDLHFRNIDEWVLMAPEADFPRRHSLPANVYYVGPCVDMQRAQFPSPVSRAPGSEYLVYVCMGTAMLDWKDDLSILGRIVEALQEVPGIQLVVATGNARVRQALKASGTRAHVFVLLPQLEVLRMANLAITHAGANTFRECIQTDTPMLAFPRELDQPGNAARIVYHGLGLRGSRRWDTAAQIRHKALRILTDPGFVQRVREMRVRIAAHEDQLMQTALRSYHRDSPGLQLCSGSE